MSLEGTVATTAENTAQGAEPVEPKWTVNEPDATESEDGAQSAAPSGDPLEKAIKNVEKKAFGKVKPEAKPGKAEPEVAAEAPKIKKYKVDGEEIELDEATADRYTQKGIMLEKRGAELAKQKRTLQEQATQVEQMKDRVQAFMDNIEKDPVKFLVARLGEDKAREIMEPFLAEKVREELMPEHERAVLSERRRAEAAESKLAQREQAENEQKMTVEEQHHLESYKKLIIDALETGGVPRTDFTAAEMANYIRRMEETNVRREKDGEAPIAYTPQQLANLVREDNIQRVSSLTGSLSKQVEVARKAGDKAAVLKCGEQLADILGESVVHALGKYHLEKMRGIQPTVPKKVLDTSKVPTDQEKGRKGAYKMSEDEYRDERKRRAEAIDRGEAVSEW